MFAIGLVLKEVAGVFEAEEVGGNEIHGCCVPDFVDVYSMAGGGGGGEDWEKAIIEDG